MKIELKAIKHFEAGSEETACFTANVYVNGKMVGTAKNQGHGGMTFVHFQDRALEAQVVAYCAKMPPRHYEGLDLKMNLDFYIDLLLEEHLKAKDEKRLVKIDQKEKKRFLDHGYPICVRITFHGTVVWVGLKKMSELDAALAKSAAKHGSIKRHKLV